MINRSASCHCKRDFCRCLQPRIKRLCQSFKLYCCSISSPSGTINLTQYKSLKHQDQSPTSCGNNTQKLLKYNSGYFNQLLLTVGLPNKPSFHVQRKNCWSGGDQKCRPLFFLPNFAVFSQLFELEGKILIPMHRIKKYQLS